MINGTTYKKGYYLADGIYAEWGTFAKTIPLSQGEKRKLFSRCQEPIRKDAERALEYSNLDVLLYEDRHVFGKEMF